MDSENSDFDGIEDDQTSATTTNSKAQVPKPSTSRPTYKLRAKSKSKEHPKYHSPKRNCKNFPKH